MSKSYFISDFHLGNPTYEDSLVREKKIVGWLNTIQHDCTSLYLLGDIFDFWYEYKTVVPKNYIRLLGKLVEFTDAGIPVYFFKGNHDMWTFSYLENEIGLKVVDNELVKYIDDKKFYLHHGDGVWPEEGGYAFVKKTFRSKWAIWLFHRLHPNFGIGLANYLSRKSRAKNSVKDAKDIPIENEYQVKFANQYIKEEHIDYFIFGHRHKPMNVPIAEKSRLINLGDCISFFTYAVFDGNEIQLKTI